MGEILSRHSSNQPSRWSRSSSSQQLKQGTVQAWFGSRVSVGSEVSKSHILWLTHGSPTWAPEDTSLSFEGKQGHREVSNPASRMLFTIRDLTGLGVGRADGDIYPSHDTVCCP